ncbi:hypothetical protein QJS10_CPB18g00866 [Acorus calamus]|uniref:Neprosin PEP catalytic domain-containing protein n=1 Tax=Acorus calamus TaxID=4465 RepID=A0AAV9CN44_ACOCL|nr:hypothetical protein QJS10_CPB18g00866 [Acorus calamus]
MNIRRSINFLLILLALSDEVIRGKAQSDQKEIQLNELLKKLNKPAVKTIEMAPSFAPKWEDILKPTFEWTWQKSGSCCPEGTVPIRRISRDDILRANSIESFGKKDVLGEDDSVETAGLKPATNPPSYGTTGAINVWNVHVEPDEWSQSALIVGNTNGDAHSFIEAGWSIHPVVFGDTKTRLYAYWTEDGYQKTGCYNIMCSGFVQVSNHTMLGSFLQPLSSLGGQQYEIEVSVFRDKKQSSWWLKVEGDNVGYWPDSIFQGFTNCPVVNWGGAVLDKRRGGKHTTTQMGSGNHPRSGLFGQSAYIARAQVIDEDGALITRTFIGHYYSKEKCYSAKPDWVPRRFPTMFAHLWVYFGGSGGVECD